ncbi:MAG: hypothetical protein KGL35_14880 [Bradyrhizobium sp.]|nr:hypothetical protein [Bradyrhizobium sp.]
MIRGVKIELGGETFQVPALTLEQLETFETDIAAVSETALTEVGAFAKERLAAMARVVHAALSRNYPELALEDLRRLLDLRNIGPAWAAVMGVSGLMEKDTPEGEAQAEAPIGQASAPVSAAGQDGAGTKPAS